MNTIVQKTKKRCYNNHTARGNEEHTIPIKPRFSYQREVMSSQKEQYLKLRARLSPKLSIKFSDYRMETIGTFLSGHMIKDSCSSSTNQTSSRTYKVSGKLQKLKLDRTAPELE